MYGYVSSLDPCVEFLLNEWPSQEIARSVLWSSQV